MESTPNNSNSDQELFAALESDFEVAPDTAPDLFSQLESETVVDRELLAGSLQLRVIDLERAQLTPDTTRINVMDVPFGTFDDCLLSADVRINQDGIAHGWIEIKSTDPLELSPLPRAVSDPHNGYWDTVNQLNGNARAFTNTSIVKALATHWPEHRIERGELQIHSYENTKEEYTAQQIADILYHQISPTASHCSTYTEYSIPTYDQSKRDEPAQRNGSILLAYRRNRSTNGESSIEIELERRLAIFIDEELHFVVARAYLDKNNELTITTFFENNETQLREPIPIKNESDLILEILTSLNSLTSARI